DLRARPRSTSTWGGVSSCAARRPRAARRAAASSTRRNTEPSGRDLAALFRGRASHYHFCDRRPFGGRFASPGFLQRDQWFSKADSEKLPEIAANASLLSQLRHPRGSQKCRFPPSSRERSIFDTGSLIGNAVGQLPNKWERLQMRFFRSNGDKVPAHIKALAEEARAGKMDRREFLALASVFG